MSSLIVQSSKSITLVGGGAVGQDDLALATSLAPVLVGADSGAMVAIDAGYDPVAVIGDLDSLSAADRARISPKRLFPIREQDSTDFDKALRSISAPLILGVGFLGGRVDHQLAAFNTLVRHANRPCVLLGAQEVIFHAPPVLEIQLEPGEAISLFPMARLYGRSRGLEWPIDGLELAPDGRVATSNRAQGAVRLEVAAPGLLVIVPRRALGAVIRAIAPALYASVPETGTGTASAQGPARA